MNPKIRKLDWFEMKTDEGTFVRFGERNWGQWQGDSLEVLQFDNIALEIVFQQATHEHPKQTEGE